MFFILLCYKNYAITFLPSRFKNFVYELRGCWTVLDIKKSRKLLEDTDGKFVENLLGETELEVKYNDFKEIGNLKYFGGKSSKI